MKLNKILTSAIVLTTLGVAVAPVAQAAAGDEAATYPSHGKIKFVLDTDPTDPVDPTDPEVPVDPTDPDVPEGTAGPLSIDYVSNFDFGTQKISGDDATYYAAPVELKNTDGDTFYRANYVQVTDKRGSGAGWKLAVKQTTQFTDSTDKTLDGAALKMSGQVLNSKNIIGDGSTTNPTILGTEVAPAVGSDTPVLSAEKNKGMGTWTDAFGTFESDTQDDAANPTYKNVSLDVPGNAIKTADETYTADFTWTLTDAGL